MSNQPPYKPEWLHLICPKCFETYKVEARLKDRMTRCPKCGTPLRLPGETSRN